MRKDFFSQKNVSRGVFVMLGFFIFSVFLTVNVLAAAGDGSVKSTIEINSNTINGPTLINSDVYGISVTGIGDLNGDGVNDIAVGAYLDDAGGANRGVIHIHFMNTDGSIDSTVEINDNTPNGPILFDSDYYGYSVTGIGDFDGDGVNDIAVGARNDDSGGHNRGAAHIHFMNTDGSIDSTVEINDNTPNGPILSDEDNYGESIASIGDLNNDGVTDIAVGAKGDSAGGTERGAVHIHFMNTDGSIDSTVEINDNTPNGPILSDSDNYGRSIASIGDLNNDGVTDIAVGGGGAVHIHFMNTDGSIDSTVEINDNTPNGPILGGTESYGGRSIANIGDLNNDGVTDIIVGGTDLIYIHFMNTDGSIDSTVEINDNTPNGPTLAIGDGYGVSVAGMGDLNNNNISDLVVGAYLDDAGGTNRGAVHIHFMAIKLPEVATTAASEIDEFTATLNANLTNIGGNGNPTRKIEYGTTSGVYTHECDAASGSVGTYTCNIENLQTDTVYYYRAASSNGEDTAYGDELSFTTIPLQDIIIPNPQTIDIQDATGDGRITIDTGMIDNASQTTTQVNVTYQTINTEAYFPSNTITTGDGSFNFQNFTLEELSVSTEQPNSRVAFRLGIPSEQLNFSQDVTVTVFIGLPYADQELDILYQNEGQSTWSTQGTCIVDAQGLCTFTTDHATIYTVNGVHSETGAAPMDINVEVQDTLSLDCYDTAGTSGDHTVSLSDSTTGTGYVVAGIPSVGQSTCDVTTNDDQGYYLTIDRSTEDVTWAGTNGLGTHAATNVLIHEDPNVDGTWYEIPDTGNGLSYYNGSNSAIWTEGTTKGLGFSVITFPDTITANNTLDNDWELTGTQCLDGSSTGTDTAKYAAVPTSAQPIAAVTQYEENSTSTTVCYKVDVLASQQSGQYAGQVTYTATSDASGYLN